MQEQPPTDDRIKRLEEGQKRLEEEVRQLREQRTEEIRAVRVEVASEDVVTQLKAINEKLGEQSALLTRIETKQNDHSELLAKHSRSISTLETTMATKDDLTAMEERLTDTMRKYLQPKPNGHKEE